MKISMGTLSHLPYTLPHKVCRACGNDRALYVGHDPMAVPCPCCRPDAFVLSDLDGYQRDDVVEILINSGAVPMEIS